MTHANYYLLDVFTHEKFGGNQLAIFPDARFIDEHLLLKIARELNLSETVFLFPPFKNHRYKMRIFTPGRELPTAGHPSVGTAYFLSREFDHSDDLESEITLIQPIGDIKVKVKYKDNQPTLVTMYQPLPTFGKRFEYLKEKLAKLLSLEKENLLDLPIQEVSCGNNTLLIPVKDVTHLAKIKFRVDLWDDLKEEVNNAFVYPFTPAHHPDGQVRGRMFAPDTGIIEDPATGSANGPLAAYLSYHDILKMPLTSLQGYEMGRPSQLHLDIEKDPNGQITAVKVGGQCTYVGKGVIYLDFD